MNAIFQLCIKVTYLLSYTYNKNRLWYMFSLLQYCSARRDIAFHKTVVFLISCTPLNRCQWLWSSRTHFISWPEIYSTLAMSQDFGRSRRLFKMTPYGHRKGFRFFFQPGKTGKPNICVVSTVSADSLAALRARAYAGEQRIDLRSRIYTKPALEGNINMLRSRQNGRHFEKRHFPMRYLGCTFMDIG